MLQLGSVVLSYLPALREGSCVVVTAGYGGDAVRVALEQPPNLLR